MMEKKHAHHNKPLSKEEKEKMIAEASKHYAGFMTALGIDHENDPNSKDTPMRVAKSFVNDLIKGRYQEELKITSFDNIEKYDGLVFQGNIDMKSMCSHHHLAFAGVVHVAYIPAPDGKIIGLSKLNRIVEYYSRRPQVQENLTQQISKHIDKVCEKNLGVAVLVEAQHTCCSHRGIKHESTMKTSKLTGVFLDNENLARQEFYDFVNNL